MRIAYFECSSGISGDMSLGALVHAGASLKKIKKELGKIPLKGCKLVEHKVKRCGLEATKIDVKTSRRSDKTLSRWKNVRRVIIESSLGPDIKEQGLCIFKSIFIAEAIMHGEPYDRIHLHELSYIDTIADIFGTLIGLRELGVEKVFASPVNIGSGTIRTAHGVLPVPAPATAELLKGIPVYSTDTPYELTTPTGAALLKGLRADTGGMPLMKITAVGIGAGSRDLKDSPNVLRVFIGEAAKAASQESVTVIETNIDDMNPQIYGYVMERLIKEGALDVYLTQVIMKKGRPGVKLTALCHENKRQSVTDTILKETTTIGMRHYKADRVTLKRKIERVDTEFGNIRVKTAEGSKAMPEYEDCKRAALRHNVPLIEVIKRVQRNIK